MRPLLIVIAVVGATHANAATVRAADCSTSAVQNAINSAAAGDTVVVPVGACTWTSGVSISGKAISLRGETVGGVTITNNSTGRPAINVNEDTSGHVEISQLAIIGNNSEYAAIDVGWGGSSGKAVLIHDNVFTDSRAIRMNTNRGVIYSNTANQPRQHNPSFVQCTPAGRITDSWKTRSTMGTADTNGESNVYVEDNVIAYSTAESIDVAGGCRIVIRHNTFDHSALSSHGADTEPAGLRHFELYDNTFQWSSLGDCDGSKTTNLPYYFFVRGGTGVITGNTGLVNMSSCAWGNKPAIALTVMNLKRQSGPNPCWSAGYPAPRQIGMGRVTGQGTDGSGRSTDSYDYVGDSEPLYIWDQPNLTTVSIQDYSPSECSGSASSSGYIVQGRDYFLGTAKPGYTRFAYPHPLRTGGLVAPRAPQNLTIN